MKVKSYRKIDFITPAEGNPRNSEGAFIELDDKRIAFAYSRYHGNGDDDGDECDISVVFSQDGGESFDVEHPITLVKASEFGVKNVMSVSLLRMQNQDIGLFFLVKQEDLLNQYYLRRFDGMLKESHGDVCCLPQEIPAYYIVNNDRVLRHTDGRLIIPAAMHDRNISLGIIQSIFTTFYVSYDDGCNWEMLPSRLMLGDSYSKTGLQEPGLAELPNGSLYCYMRTDRMLQYESVSVDGKNWSDVKPSKFTSPDSPMLIKRNHNDGSYYAVWNPIPKYQTRPESPSWGRTPLVIAKSDDGVNFSEPYILEDDEARGFCYPAVHFLDDKNILIAYCSGGLEEGHCLNRITLGKLELE